MRFSVRVERSDLWKEFECRKSHLPRTLQEIQPLSATVGEWIENESEKSEENEEEPPEDWDPDEIYSGDSEDEVLRSIFQCSCR